MIHHNIIQHERDRGGAVLHETVPVVYLLGRPPPITTTPLMMTGCPLIPPSLKSPLVGGVGVEEVKVARAVVTPMGLAPLGKTKEKGWIFEQNPNTKIRW